MPGAPAPVDMLHKCRGHFAAEAEAYRKTERIAGSVLEKRVAAAYAETNERFMSEIDACLRDWDR